MRDCLNFRLTGNEPQVFCGDSGTGIGRVLKQM